MKSGSRKIPKNLNEHIDLDEQELDNHEWQSIPLFSFEWPPSLWQFDLDTNSPDQIDSDMTTYLDTGQQQNIDDIDSVTTTCLPKTSSPRIELVKETEETEIEYTGIPTDSEVKFLVSIFYVIHLWLSLQ